MRILSLILIVTTLLSGNEVERIESIVNDVTKLRENYEICQSTLKRLEEPGSTMKSEERVISLEREISAQRDLYEREIERLKQELLASEKKMELLSASLQDSKAEQSACQQRIDAQQRQLAKLDEGSSVQVKKIYIKSDPEPCPDPNPFPKLLMKEEYRVMKENGELPGSKKEVVNRLDEEKVESATLETTPQESTYFKARPFRMKNDAKIYDAPNGRVIAQWEARTSFTSGEKRGGWIRITGYFVDRKWHPTGDRMMWVKEINTLIR